MMANKRVAAATTAGLVMCGIDGNRKMDSQPAASASNQEKVTTGCLSLLSLKKKKEKRTRQLRRGEVKLLVSSLHMAAAFNYTSQTYYTVIFAQSLTNICFQGSIVKYSWQQSTLRLKDVNTTEDKSQK